MAIAPLVLRHPVIVIRHGQTDWNAEGRFQGQTDIPLNATGEIQARGNGERLLHLFGDALASHAFIASPMGRTLQTMELVRAALGLPPKAYKTDVRLVEVSFGAWERRTLDEIAADDPAVADARAAAKWTFVPPRGESYAGYAERVRPVFTGLSGPSVIVAHGGTFRALYAMTGMMTVDEAANAEVPQDRVLQFVDGSHRWL